MSGALRTHYPGFLFGLATGPEVPVFVYHEPAAADFAADLRFLTDNGYRTLGLDEYLHAGGRRRGAERSVLLTFDDARAGFCSTVLPLLEEFEARASLFVPSAWPDSPWPSGSSRFLGWSDLRAVRDSGRVDLGSHAHRHGLVPVNRQPVAFAGPAIWERFDVFDFPLRANAGRLVGGLPPAGTPILRAAPLLSAQRWLREDPAVAAGCIEWLERAGGAAALAEARTVRELARHCERLAARHPGREATPGELTGLVREELGLAREVFAAQLGFHPRVLAYPWMLGTPESLAIAAQAGFTRAFGVALDYRRARAQRDALPVYGRCKADWLRRLPGRDRRPFLDIAGAKIRGLSATQHLAHGP